MLDFCEAVGTMLNDDQFRGNLFDPRFRVIVGETTAGIEFPASSYLTTGTLLGVRDILTSRLSHKSLSLYADGEILRVSAKSVLAAHVTALAANLASRGLADPHATTTYFTALGALTIDQNLRAQFLSSPGPLSVIPGLTRPEVETLQKVLGDANYIAEADGFCFDGWAQGCGVRILHYSGYLHPRVKP